jgi:hypothetical protein
MRQPNSGLISCMSSGRDEQGKSDESRGCGQGNNVGPQYVERRVTATSRWRLHTRRWITKPPEIDHSISLWPSVLHLFGRLSVCWPSARLRLRLKLKLRRRRRTNITPNQCVVFRPVPVPAAVSIPSMLRAWRGRLQ